MMFSKTYQSLKSIIIQLLTKVRSPYMIISFSMALTVCALLGVFAWTEYKINLSNINSKLNLEAKRISRGFNDIVDHTSFIMKVMAMQIQSNHKDTKYISNILYKYSMNQKLHSAISSSVFAWLNEDNIKVVDSLSGDSIIATNLSNREYIKTARNEPHSDHI